MGCVTQVGEQGLNVGRDRRARSPAGRRRSARTTVDRQCGSSMQAAFNAAAAIWPGQLDVVVAGGRRDDVARADGLEPRRGRLVGLLRQAARAWQIVPQGISAEVIADGVGALARGARRVLATSRTCGRSRAIDEGRFEHEIVPIEVCEPARRASLFAVDETPRRDTSLEKLASLRRRSEDGVVTAGNSSQIVDGAAAVLVASEERASRARARAARAVRLVRARRRRPVPDAARQPAGVRARAREAPGSAGTTSP